MNGFTRKMIGLSSTTAVLAGHLLISPLAFAADASIVEQGKALSFDRKKGNCLACHMIQGGASPGNIAPPLIAMKGRYPNKEDLRKQIYDATVANPESSMPPFGKHDALTKSELDKVVEFIWTL